MLSIMHGPDGFRPALLKVRQNKTEPRESWQLFRLVNYYTEYLRGGKLQNHIRAYTGVGRYGRESSAHVDDVNSPPLSATADKRGSPVMP